MAIVGRGQGVARAELEAGRGRRPGQGGAWGLLGAFLLAPAVVSGAAPAPAPPADAPRPYLDLRIGDTNPLVRAHDVVGFSLGVETSPHLAFELAVDSYEVFAEAWDAKFVELSILGFEPMVRLSWPVLGGRLVPYLLGGAGVAVLELNDGRAATRLADGSARSAAPMASLGGGAEFMLEEGVAVGLQVRRTFMEDVQVSGDGWSRTLAAASGLLAATVRVRGPDPAAPPAVAAHLDDRARLYLRVAVGGIFVPDDELAPDVRLEPEQDVFGSGFSNQFAVALGTNLTRWGAFEFAFEPTEFRLDDSAVGVLSEYAVYPLLLRGRLRWPLDDGRIEPFVSLAGGVNIAQVNDLTIEGEKVGIAGDDVGPVGMAGFGLDWMVTESVALGVEADYSWAGGNHVAIGERRAHIDLGGLALRLGVRVFLASL